MRRSNKQRRDTTPEREALRAVIHECEAFIHWADWSRLTERSRRSITQMMEIIKGVALKGLRKSEHEQHCQKTGKNDSQRQRSSIR
jgi:hypothetical protein